MGSDAEHKNEIEPAIITGAGLYVADSLSQTSAPRRIAPCHRGRAGDG
jgi:ornithine cyclodeaminase/alanine dehydrogenase-like protein (mu-crystallin family)